MSYETRKLTDIDFPVYFSLVPDPGYDTSYLASCEIDGEWKLFEGDIVDLEDNRTGITWGGQYDYIKGSLHSLLREK